MSSLPRVARLSGLKMTTRLKSAGVCKQWPNGVWGHPAVDQDRLYNLTAFVWGTYHWLLTAGGRCECDDFNVGVSSGDFWKVFVRKELGSWNIALLVCYWSKHFINLINATSSTTIKGIGEGLFFPRCCLARRLLLL